jgi:hypothetical protein
LFVVRDDSRNSDVLYGLPFTTYQAYNPYGGKSLYPFNSTGANTVAGNTEAVKVSFDRPFDYARIGGTHDWYTRSDYPLVYWLERYGYDVAYQSDTDMELNGARVRNHKAYVLGGHDEYYSTGMRTALEQARDAGTGLFNSGANAVFWKIASRRTQRRPEPRRGLLQDDRDRGPGSRRSHVDLARSSRCKQA